MPRSEMTSLVERSDFMDWASWVESLPSVTCNKWQKMAKMAKNGKKWQKMAKNDNKCFAGKFGHTITVTKTITTLCGAVFGVKDGRPRSL